MKHKILPIISAVFILSSCSTAYKSTQTPDDVYYSPTTGIEEKETAKASKQNDRYETYVSSNDDRYLRMKVHNYQVWSGIDDYAYWYDSRYDFSSCAPSRFDLWNRYSYGYNYNYYNGFIYYFGGWNGYYRPTPVAYVIGYKNPKTNVGSNSGSYLTAYKNSNYNNSNFNAKTNPYNNGSFGSLVRQVFSSPSNNNSNSSSNTSWDRPARTFTPSTNTSTSTPTTSSSAGGSSGGYSSTGSSSSTPRATRQ
jgi:hypothetical protein